MKDYNEEYKIKVNGTFFEKENLSKLNNKKVDIPTKKSILYKLKFNPEIIINEFHQTSNNINKNINIKKYKQYNSKILNRNNNSNKEENLYAFNKYYHSYDMDDFKKEEDNDEYISKKTYTNRKTNNDIFKSILYFSVFSYFNFITSSYYLLLKLQYEIQFTYINFLQKSPP